METYSFPRVCCDRSRHIGLTIAHLHSLGAKYTFPHTLSNPYSRNVYSQCYRCNASRLPVLMPHEVSAIRVIVFYLTLEKVSSHSAMKSLIFFCQCFSLIYIYQERYQRHHVIDARYLRITQTQSHTEVDIFF